jgi:hypothetical protein
LENIYLLKNVDVPDYYLGGNVEFLGDPWKNLRLGLTLSARSYIRNVITNVKSLFGKECNHNKTLMSEGYHPKIDHSSLCTGEESAKYKSMVGC